MHKHEVTESSEEWHVGNYYNYCTASAGTVCDPEGENERDAEEDICPFNWRMPTGGIDGEYGALLSALSNDSDLFVNTLHLPLSGRYYDDSQSYVNQDGYFWSSTYRDGSRMRYVSYDGYDVNPAGSYNRDRGYSMRCVAKVSEFGSGDYEWVDDINTHTIDEDGTLTLRIELDPQALLEVIVDGQVVDPELYELLDGEETLIQFKAEYLDTLDEGEHPVTAVYQEGVIIETEMIIMRAPEEEPEAPEVPNTGTDSVKADHVVASEETAYITASIITAICICIFIRIKRTR